MFPKTHRRFTDYLQLAFDSRYRLWILPECIEVHVLCELLDGGDCIAYIAEAKGSFNLPYRHIYGKRRI